MPTRVRGCHHQSILSCHYLFEEHLLEAKKQYSKHKAYAKMAPGSLDCVGVERWLLNPEKTEDVYRDIATSMQMDWKHVAMWHEWKVPLPPLYLTFLVCSIHLRVGNL